MKNFNVKVEEKETMKQMERMDSLSSKESEVDADALKYVKAKEKVRNEN